MQSVWDCKCDIIFASIYVKIHLPPNNKADLFPSNLSEEMQNIIMTILHDLVSHKNRGRECIVWTKSCDRALTPRFYQPVLIPISPVFTCEFLTYSEQQMLRYSRLLSRFRLSL